MKRGTQIAYIPDHANGDLDHPDVEAGFVTSWREGDQAAYCRYWSKVNPDELRTKANSELTPCRYLEEIDSCPQWRVDAELEKIDSQSREATERFVSWLNGELP